MEGITKLFTFVSHASFHPGIPLPYPPPGEREPPGPAGAERGRDDVAAGAAHGRRLRDADRDQPPGALPLHQGGTAEARGVIQRLVCSEVNLALFSLILPVILPFTESGLGATKV